MITVSHHQILGISVGSIRDCEKARVNHTDGEWGAGLVPIIL